VKAGREVLGKRQTENMKIGKIGKIGGQRLK
jgi:hypothetical protein